MNETKQEKRAAMGVQIGSASIVMIFAVLCLTIFATLSFQTASHEQRLAEKTASAAQAYYVADGRAEEIYDRICTVLQNTMVDETTRRTQLAELDVTVKDDGNQSLLYYAVPVDKGQELRVMLCLRTDGVLRVDQWSVVATSQWEFDDRVHVWDGEL